jgi:hypothetical protein
VAAHAMSQHIVEITEMPRDPLGGASGEKRKFHVEFLGKLDNDEFPYTVANEVVAEPIGMALGLNVPTVLTHRIGNVNCALIQMRDKDPRMQHEPPATAAALAEYVRSHPEEIHGAIVFDLFMANNDRAFAPVRRNLFLDTEGRLVLYDNGNCCFYRNRTKASIVAGISRLNAVEADLTALFDMDHKANHYRESLTDWSLVQEWCHRIQQLPDFLLKSAVHRIPSGCVNQTERDRLLEFLLKRREYLYDQIVQNRDKFVGLPATGA